MGLTIQDLAAEAKISMGVIARAEAGGPINPDSLERLAPKVGSSYKQLLRPRESAASSNPLQVIPEIRSGDLVINIRFKAIPPEVFELATKMLTTMVHAGHEIELDGISAGSVILHIRMASQDAKELVSRIERITYEARQILRKAGESYLRNLTPAKHKRHLRKYMPVALIAGIVQIHFPATKLNEELFWRTEGQLPEPPKIPIA